MSIYEILPALDLTQSVHAKISIGMQRGVKFKISRIPLIGLETRLGWRTDRKFLPNPNLNEIRHGHECSRIWKLSGNFTLLQCINMCWDFLGRDILGATFFRAESSLIQSSCRSFIRVVVPYEISKVNFRVETKFLVSMSEEI